MSLTLAPLIRLVEDRPALLALGVFLAITMALGLLFATLMRQSGASLRPLVWLFGFMALVAGPQFAVHLLDETTGATGAAGAAAERTGLQPVPWNIVYGPQADPDLMVDGRRAAPGVLDGAQEARLSFSRRGGSALAARFASADDAQRALNAYGHFFRFGSVSGSDAMGWTAHRYEGQGEWNHIVAVERELYAWTGPTRASVVAERERALGPLGAQAAGGASASSGSATAALETRGAASGHLARHPEQLAVFVAINLLAVVLWFFKGSAWAAREAPVPGAAPAAAAQLEQRLLSLNRQDQPTEVRRSPDGRTLTVDWRYADARWFDLMSLHRMRHASRLVLQLDESARTVRVREYWSAFDASAGRNGLRLNWRWQTGIQFFAVQHERVLGVQLDASGQATGALSETVRFDARRMKAPFIAEATDAGWAWQPLVWNVPGPLRWLLG